MIRKHSESPGSTTGAHSSLRFPHILGLVRRFDKTSWLNYNQYLRIGYLECRREPASGILKADSRPHSRRFSHLLIIGFKFPNTGGTCQFANHRVASNKSDIDIGNSHVG